MPPIASDLIKSTTVAACIVAIGFFAYFRVTGVKPSLGFYISMGFVYLFVVVPTIIRRWKRSSG